MALFATVLLGVGLLAVSAFYPSSSLAIVGTGIISLGAVLLYVTPVKHVPLTLLNASAEVAVANIERLISDLNLTERGIYLPPKDLKKDPILVFISATASDEINEKPLTDEKTGVLVTPPGAALASLFEKELGLPFTNTDLKQILNKLQRLLVEDMGLAESAEIQVQGNTITLEIVGSVLDEICRKTDSQPKTHMQVGCLLSSAFACTLAKVTEKPVTILNETRNKETTTTHIEYQISSRKTIQYENMELTPLICSDASLIESEAKKVTTRLKTLQLKPPIDLDASTRKPSITAIRINMSESGGSNSLDMEIPPHALDYLEKNGDLFILADIKNPQYSYSKIKGHDADLVIKFEKFVTICKTNPGSQNNLKGLKTAFSSTKAFGLFLGEQTDYSLAAYVGKSGFSTIDDWINASNGANEIPECSIGGKIFYLYHVQVTSPFALQLEPAQIFEG